MDSERRRGGGDWMPCERLSHLSSHVKPLAAAPEPDRIRCEPGVTASVTGLALQSLDGTVLLELRLVKLSMQRWNFFMTRAPSSQLHSEYGKPIHLHKYSGSLEDEVL